MSTRINSPAAILNKTQAEPWIATTIQTVEEHRYGQATVGRPSWNTQYVRQTKERFERHWQSKVETLQYDDHTDGIFRQGKIKPGSFQGYARRDVERISGELIGRQ